jgi:hypothetical protein
VERDVLCVDGVRVRGSEVGYEGVRGLLVDRMRRLLPSRAPTRARSEPQDSAAMQASDAQPDFSSLYSADDSGSEVLSSFAAALLRVVNRTESGHWSFSLVRHHMDVTLIQL